MAKTKFCEGVSDISDSYMGFIIDQWGVLHDGEDLFPGAVDTLKELKERKKTIIILSNTEGNAEENKAKLKKMGLGPSLYNAIVTPTEIIQEGFKNRKEGLFAGLGDKVYVFGRRGQDEILKDTGVEVVDEIDQANSVLILGMDYPRKTLIDYDPLIRKALEIFRGEIQTA